MPTDQNMSTQDSNMDSGGLDIVKESNSNNNFIKIKFRFWTLLFLLILVPLLAVGAYIVLFQTDNTTFFGNNNFVDEVPAPKNAVLDEINTKGLNTEEYPAAFVSFGENNEWQYNYIQPVIQDVYEKNQGMYVLGEFTNTNRDIFLVGTLEGKTFPVIYEIDRENKFDDRTHSYIDNNFNAGDRVGFVYLSEYPDKSVRTEEYCKDYEYQCDYADLYDSLEEAGILLNSPTEILGTEDYGIIPAMQYYLNLFMEPDEN